MTESSATPPFEEKEIRCPKLGGPVTFGYCRTERGSLPCGRALVCWSGYFDVETLFREHFSPDEFDKCFFEPPSTKMVTLMELIEQAKKRLEQEEKT